MSFLLDIFSVVAVAAGVAFYVAGTVGLLRFPDALSRLHALAKTDNLGLGLIVLGLLPQATSFWMGAKMVAAWVLAQVASGAVSQLLAEAALRDDSPGETS